MSTLDPDNPLPERDESGAEKGRDTGSLGPSDSSDSGSDIAGAKRHGAKSPGPSTVVGASVVRPG